MRSNATLTNAADRNASGRLATRVACRTSLTLETWSSSRQVSGKKRIFQLAATLRDHRSEAALYKRLATLNSDAAVDGDLDSLEWRGVPRTEFLALCDELGFETVGSRVHRWRDGD